VQALDQWLRTQLGRRLNLVILRVEAQTSAAWEALVAEANRYREVYLITSDQPGGEDSAPVARLEYWERAIKQAMQHDPDALLVWYEAPDEAEGGENANWPQAVVQVADALNIFDRTMLALSGPGVTRASARRRGFEDGFPVGAEMPQADVFAMLATLARIALDREMYRRRGSSPPCYL
ncbi:MAG TPA: hypothetical protein VKQ36_10460, partial [Ktedonobacterales bacterium]|nr:hypothetical protein [Ktedonobacterales bacterium]